MHFDLYRNGTRVGRIKPEALTEGFVQSALTRAAQQEFTVIAEEAKSAMESLVNTLVRRRVLVNKKATYLADAYSQAMSRSKVSNEKGIITLSLLDIKMMDRLLPMGGEGNTRKGWWRIYESGSPGERVGGSSDYGFVTMSGKGKHGEGAMVKITDENASYVKPHPGVMPIRITYRFKNILRDLFRVRKDRVMDSLARTIASG